MTRLTLWMAACCLLAACAAGPQPTLVPLAPEPPLTVPPQASLLVPPAPLPQPTSGRMRDLEANHLQVARAYHQLASQLCGLLLHLKQPVAEPCRPWLAPDPVP